MDKFDEAVTWLCAVMDVLKLEAPAMQHAHLAIEALREKQARETPATRMDLKQARPGRKKGGWRRGSSAG